MAASVAYITQVVDPNDLKPTLVNAAKKYQVQLELKGNIEWTFWPHFGMYPVKSLDYVNLVGKVDTSHEYSESVVKAGFTVLSNLDLDLSNWVKKILFEHNLKGLIDIDFLKIVEATRSPLHLFFSVLWTAQDSFVARYFRLQGRR